MPKASEISEGTEWQHTVRSISISCFASLGRLTYPRFGQDEPSPVPDPISSMSALEHALASALRSRERRAIRRRLPSTPASPPPVDFSSNDYLSLSSSTSLRAAFIRALASAPPTEVLGSGGSRLLIPQRAHSALEKRLATFFCAPVALLFNSGFDANAGFFATVPQPGDAVLLDELVHASVHDGVRASRACGAQYGFAHNDVGALEQACLRVLRECPGVKAATASVFIAVESVYSMDGTLAPLVEIVRTLDHLFPHGNAYLVVDEAHATGIYGPQGRGLVAALGLEDKVFARLHTFGKALAGTGGALARVVSSSLKRPITLLCGSGDAGYPARPGLPCQLRPAAHLHNLTQLREHHRRELCV